MLHTYKSWKIPQHEIKQYHTIPSRLLPCTCYLLRCRCLAKLCLDTLCVLGTTPVDQPLCTPNPNLKIQNSEFTYCNDKSPQEATTRKLDKYDILQPLLTQQGWMVLLPQIFTIDIRDSIHTNIMGGSLSALYKQHAI